MILINKRQLLIIFVPALLMLAAVAMVATLFHVEVSLMTRDVARIGGIHPLSGFLSSLGILLWCVASAICFFAAVMLRKVKQTESFWFLFASALLTAYLLFDDLFLFHETLAYMYFGINEKIILVILGVTVFAYLFRFRRIILKTNYSVLLLALVLLSLSVLIDITLYSWLSIWRIFFEDGFKWLGIVGWCGYYVHTSYLLTIQTLNSRNH